MIALKLILVVILSVGVYCECDHEWQTFVPSDTSLVETRGLSAGQYPWGSPSYIGRGYTDIGDLPGRIQTKTNVGFYYTANSKVQQTTEYVEFLVDNKNYSYTWEKGSSLKCVNDAVSVDDKYFIGRVLISGVTLVGRVVMGSRGLWYGNANGHEVLTNDYEVLVCSEKSKADYIELLERSSDTCNSERESLKVEKQNLIHEVSMLGEKSSHCEERLNDARESIELYKRVIAQENNCPTTTTTTESPISTSTIDLISSSMVSSTSTETITSTSTVSPRTTVPSTSTLISTISPSSTTIVPSTCPPPKCPQTLIQNKETEVLRETLESTKVELKELKETRVADNNRHKLEVEDLNLSIESYKTKIADLDLQIKELKALQTNNNQCVGIAGCIKALEPVETVTNEDIESIIKVIKPKMNPDDASKVMSASHEEDVLKMNTSNMNI